VNRGEEGFALDFVLPHDASNFCTQGEKYNLQKCARKSFVCCSKSSGSSWTKHEIRGKIVHVKRDDLLSPFPRVSGNKARKLHSLLEHASQLACNHRTLNIVSWGGLQSNAMLALSAFAHSVNIPFIYFTKPIPKWIAQSLSSSPSTNNLDHALSLGMKLIPLTMPQYDALSLEFKQLNKRTKSHENTTVDSNSMASKSILNSFIYSYQFVESILPESVLLRDEDDVIIVPQGISNELAREGCYKLAEEVYEYSLGLELGVEIQFLVACGTGVLALYVSQRLNELCGNRIQVVAVPVVGDSEMLRDEWNEMNGTHARIEGKDGDADEVCVILSDAVSGKQWTVKMLESPNKFRFAQPCESVYTIWNELKTVSNLELDLIYGATTWTILLQKHQAFSNNSVPDHHRQDPIILYYHCGGLEGNASQISRYKRLNLL